MLQLLSVAKDLNFGYKKVKGLDRRYDCLSKDVYVTLRLRAAHLHSSN